MDVRREYAAPVYERKNIDNIGAQEIHFVIDDQLFFEVLLMKIRTMTIRYSTEKRRNERRNEKQIEQKLIQLQADADESGSQNEILEDEIRKLQSQLEGIRKQHMKGVLIRSKVKWAEEGEKPTRYFCTLEKRNFINKCLSKLSTNHEGHYITDQKEILVHVRKFYQELYSSRDSTLKSFNASLIQERSPHFPPDVMEHLDRDLEMMDGWMDG